MGPFLQNHVNGKMEDAAKVIIQQQNFSNLFT
jgi:hypothetical protein